MRRMSSLPQLFRLQMKSCERKCFGEAKNEITNGVQIRSFPLSPLLPYPLSPCRTSCMQQLQIMGRCTVDIRVCASPGRDRGVDERRAEEIGSASESGGGVARRGRKRPRSELSCVCVDVKDGSISNILYTTASFASSQQYFVQNISTTKVFISNCALMLHRNCSETIP